MKITLTNGEIQALIEEEKYVNLEFEELFSRMKDKNGHREFDYTIPGKDGSSFYLKLRQNRKNTLDFSAILGYSPKEINTVFKLIRYNGKSHEHRNVLEKETAFYDFHIHKATERYQLAGRKEEFFAETTDRYSNLRGALRCLIADCNVSLKENPQLSLSIT
jgi:hypothetical protein